MKKTILYSLAAFAMFGLASCNGDYDDWASPQSYGQDAAAAQYGLSFAQGSEINSILPTDDGLVHLLTVNSTDSSVSGYTIKSLTVNGTDMSGEMSGNDICVSSTDLEKLVITENSSRAAVARPIEVKANVSINLSNGDAVTTTTVADVNGTVTPEPVPEIDPNGYYILGGFDGVGWNLSSPYYMTSNGDGTYSATLVASGDETYYGFYAASKYSDSDWNSVNSGKLTCSSNGDDATEGLLVYENDPLYGDVDLGNTSPKISGAGKYKLTLDMNNLTYKVENAGAEVWYLIGSDILDGSWSNNGTANVGTSLAPMAYIGGTKVSYSGYFSGSGFKLIKTPGSWDDQWGASGNSYVKNDGGSSNIMVPSAGYYTVTLDYVNDELTVEPMAAEPTTYAEVGIAGNFTGDSWPYVAMTPCSTSNNHLWKYELNTETDTEGKFLVNGWSPNWGAEDFPTGVGTNNGPNIPITAGNYIVIFNDITGGYNFVKQ